MGPPDTPQQEKRGGAWAPLRPPSNRREGAWAPLRPPASGERGLTEHHTRARSPRRPQAASARRCTPEVRTAMADPPRDDGLRIVVDDDPVDEVVDLDDSRDASEDGEVD